MRQRAGEGRLSWRAVFSEEVAAMLLYLPSAGLYQGTEGSQDVEGGRGQSWGLRIDSMVQGCFLGSDLRNREGPVLMPLQGCH